MRIINKTFIAGMLAMALVFGMMFAGCEQETVTKEVLVAGPPGSTTTKEVPIDALPASGPDAVKAFLNGDLGGNVKKLYITSQITLDGSGYVLGSDKTIVVTNGTLPANLNTLALPNAGAVFNISAPPPGVAELKVNGTLTVKGNITLGSATDDTQSGKLTIESGGKVIVASGASIAVTTDSQIQLVTTTSALVFEDTTAKLNVVGTIGDGEAVVGTTGGDALIVIPDETPDLTIGTGNVTINGSAANGGQLGKEGGFTGSTKTVSSGSLDSVKLEDGETLIVSGNVTASKDLEVSGTLEVTGRGKLTVDTNAKLTIEEGGTLDLGKDATIAGDGTIDNQGTIKTATESGAALAAILGAAAGTIEATGEVEISSGETVTVQKETDLTLAGDVKIENGGKLDLSDLFTPVTVGGGGGPTGGTAQGSATLEGTIEIASGGEFHIGVSAAVLGETASVPTGLEFGEDAGVKVSKGGKITLTVASTEIEYIGTAATAYYQWDSTSSNASDYIEINENKLTLSGKIIANHTPGTDVDHTTIIAEGSDITLKFRWTILGKLIVEKTALLTIDTHATIQSPAPQASAQLWIMDTGKVQVSGTIKVATSSGGYVGWIALDRAGSNLTLLPGGKLDIPVDSAIYTYTYPSGNRTEGIAPRVSVYASTDTDYVTPTGATNTGTDTNFELTTGSPGAAITVQLGKLQFVTTAEDEVDKVTGSNTGTATAGALIAGPGTAIVFLGASGS